MEQKRKAKRQTRKRKSGLTYNSRINDRYIRVEIIEYSDKESTQSGKREIINRGVINVTNREYEDVISLVESLNISEDFTVRKSSINLNYD